MAESVEPLKYFNGFRINQELLQLELERKQNAEFSNIRTVIQIG
jgi:hypothetical protein